MAPSIGIRRLVARPKLAGYSGSSCYKYIDSEIENQARRKKLFLESEHVKRLCRAYYQQHHEPPDVYIHYVRYEFGYDKGQKRQSPPWNSSSRYAWRAVNFLPVRTEVS